MATGKAKQLGDTSISTTEKPTQDSASMFEQALRQELSAWGFREECQDKPKPVVTYKRTRRIPDLKR